MSEIRDRESAMGTSLTVSELPAVPELPSGKRVRHRWIIRRIVIAALSLFAVSIIVFAATQLLPGNAAQEILGRTASPSSVRILTKQLGLDRPAVVQYASWLKGVLRGNLGSSLVAHEPVSTLMGPALLNSTILIVVSALISVVVSIIAGVAAAARRDRPADGIFNVFVFIFTAVPEFIVGTVLVILFATVVFKVLPAISVIPPGSGPFDHPNIFVLPIATLVLACVPYLGRLVRGSMIDVLDSEYIRMARFKGLNERRILYRHALPNALLPLIQGVAVVIGYLAGGIVAVEFVFGFPGIGTLLTQAISTRDVPVIQAASLVLASVYIVVNLAADLLVVFVTPRLRSRQS